MAGYLAGSGLGPSARPEHPYKDAITEITVRVTVDTTVQAQVVTFPTDAKLLHVARGTPFSTVSVDCSALMVISSGRKPASDSAGFACGGFCGDEVYLRSGRYDYPDWRSVRTAQPKGMVVGDVPRRR